MLTITVDHDPEVGFIAKARLTLPKQPAQLIVGKWKPTEAEARRALAKPLGRKAKTLRRNADRLRDRANEFEDTARSMTAMVAGLFMDDLTPSA
jgi:hypothetical protein